MTISAREREMLDWLDSRQQDMLDLLERMVNTDSGSNDKQGVDAVGEILQREFEADGIECSRIAMDRHGDILRASVAQAQNDRPILLLGHRDTVFGKGEAERRPFTVRDGRAYGPGVADMKAGLVMNAYLLKGFSRYDLSPSPIVALFTSDEEIASPSSRPVIEAEARRARLVFNSEPGRPGGNVVTGRKGGIFFRCQVKGKSAHSGVNYTEGASAIEELARKITRWHALTDLQAGTTVNIGLISGGQSTNTVAPNAECSIDLRYVDPAHRDDMVQAITAIAERCTVDGTSAEIRIQGEFKPLMQSEASRQLFEHHIRTAREIGLTLAGEYTGGCADSGLTAAVGTPTLCAVGPVGGKAHTEEEYMEIETFLSRTQALALTIMRLSEGTVQ